MKVVLVEVGKPAKITDIPHDLKAMQTIVEGPIQALYPWDDPVALVCNEEGKLLGLPANRALRDESGAVYDIVCGTFFLCGAPSDTETFASLTPEQIARLERQFHAPEIFVGMGGRIVCLPME